MEKAARQYGLFSLFLLMTAAAGSFAIIRLPLPLVAKLVMVQTVAVCFFGWAVRNRKYADPRLPQPKPSTRQVLMSLVPGLLGSIAWLLFVLLLYLKIIVP